MFTATIRTKLATAADKESARYAMGAVLIDPTTAQAAATDGRIMAVVPIDSACDEDSPTPVLVPGPLCKPPTKNKPLRLACNGQATHVDTRVTMPYIEARYPNVGKVLTSAAEAAERATVVVRLDAGLLHRLAQAIVAPGGELAVTLAITTDQHGAVDGAIGVAGNAGVGLIMPMGHDKPIANDIPAKLRQAATIKTPA